MRGVWFGSTLPSCYPFPTMTRTESVGWLKNIAYAGIYGGLLMPLVFIPTVIFPFVFSKIIVFQILIGLTFPAYAALAWMEPKYRPPKAPLLFAILAYFAAITLSVVFSVDPMRSWWGNQERMNGLFTLLHFLAWLTMAVGVIKTWDGWRKLLNYEIVLSVFMALVALLQLVKKDLLLFTAGPRVGGLLDNPIYMGAYQIFNLSFLALLFFKTKNASTRWLYAAAAVINLSAFMAAQSRGALVGLAATIAVFVAYYAFFAENKRARWGVIGAAALALMLYGGAYLARDTAFVQQNSVLNRFTNLSLASETRLIAWDIAWKGFVERPLTGWGLDTFHILFNLNYNPKSLEFGYYETWFDRAHNTVLDVLSMTGTLGFLTFAAIFVTLFYSVWRAHRKGWIDLPIAAILTALPVGYFLQNLFVFDHPAAFSMSYLLFALVIVATRPGFMASTPEQTEGVARPFPLASFAIVQVLFLVAVWQFSVQPFRASAATIQYNSWLTQNPVLAWEAIQKAERIPTPYVDERSFLLARNIAMLAANKTLTQYPEWEQWVSYAKQVNEQQITSHPLNTQPIFAYARLLQDVAPLLPTEQQRPTLQHAEALYQRALETSPNRQQLLFSLAQLYTMVGEKQLAYDTVIKARDLNPNIGEAWWYVGLIAWYDLDRKEEGIDHIIKAVTAYRPYIPTRARDGLNVAQAAAARGETEVLQSLFLQLPSLSQGSIELFLDIARAYEQAGLIEQRDTILTSLEAADASVTPMIQALREGRATTIDESIQVAGMSAATSSAP